MPKRSMQDQQDTAGCTNISRSEKQSHQDHHRDEHRHRKQRPELAEATRNVVRSEHHEVARDMRCKQSIQREKANYVDGAGRGA